jgi:ketosteroid isomerase-like protein
MRWIGVGSMAVLMMTAPLTAHEKASSGKNTHAVSAETHDASAAVDAFHAALRRADTKAAAMLLADDVLIFESGGVERTKAEYAAHHLPADAEFSRSVSSLVTRRTVHSDGSLAWVASEGRTTGTYKGKRLDLLTTETMILRDVGGTWRIIHVHWSSATKPITDR